MTAPQSGEGRRQAGFSLLEVLVALAIVGVALAAAMRAIGVTTNSNGMLFERAMALWSAENRLVELRMARPPAGTLPAPVDCPQGGLDLVCTVTLQRAGASLTAVAVQVHDRRQPGQALANLSTLLPD